MAGETLLGFISAENATAGTTYLYFSGFAYKRHIKPPSASRCIRIDRTVWYRIERLCMVSTG
jgi:hypothetical protein